MLVRLPKLAPVAVIVKPLSDETAPWKTGALVSGVATMVSEPTGRSIVMNPTGSVVAVVWALIVAAARIVSAHAAMEEERRCFILFGS